MKLKNCEKRHFVFVGDEELECEEYEKSLPTENKTLIDKLSTCQICGDKIYTWDESAISNYVCGDCFIGYGTIDRQH